MAVNLRIEKSSGQLEIFNLEKAIFSLEKANKETSEQNFQASQILEKTLKYLEIILDSPEKIISSEKFKNLLVKVLQENNFPDTANSYLNFSTQLIEGQIEAPYFSSPAQILIQKIYGSSTEFQTLNTTELFQKITTLCKEKTLSESILNLILKKRFLPPHNLLKPKLKQDNSTLILEDDLNEIFSALKQFSFNFQNFIQTNLNFSHLRPKNSLIKSNLGASCGPVSFMKIFLTTFETLKLGLNNQPYLNQKIILNIHHPDILEYLIFIKNQKNHSTNKNLNYLVELTPSFLEALYQKADYELINPQNQQTVNFLSSSNIFDLLLTTIKENPQLGFYLNSKESFSRNDNFLTSGLNLAAYVQEGQFNFSQLQSDLQLIENFHDQLNLAKNLQFQINFSGFYQALELMDFQINSIHALEFLENTLNIIQQNLTQTIPTINLNTFQHLIFGCKAGMEIPENNSDQEKSLPELSLKLQKIVEKSFPTLIDKSIFLSAKYDLEEIKKTLVTHFKEGLFSFNFSHFAPLEEIEKDQNDLSNKYLSPVYSNRRRKPQEIQPPLFKLKKTEEISLPPIHSAN
jgi:HEPN domain-containing protein